MDTPSSFSLQRLGRFAWLLSQRILKAVLYIPFAAAIVIGIGYFGSKYEGLQIVILYTLLTAFLVTLIVVVWLSVRLIAQFLCDLWKQAGEQP